MGKVGISIPFDRERNNVSRRKGFSFDEVEKSLINVDKSNSVIHDKKEDSRNKNHHGGPYLFFSYIR